MQAFKWQGKILVRDGKLAVDARCCCDDFNVLTTGGHSFTNGGGNSEHPYCEEFIRTWKPGDVNCTVTQNDSQLHTWQSNPVIPAWQGAGSQSSMEVILRNKATGNVAFSAHTSDNGAPGVLPSITWHHPADFTGVCNNLVANGWNGCGQAGCVVNPLP